MSFFVIRHRAKQKYQWQMNADERSKKMPSRSPLRLTTRAAAAFVTIAAWFLLSNHCALGVIAPVEAAADACPMHSAPAKKEPAAKTPCCKELRAVVAKCVGASPVWQGLIALREYATGIVPKPASVDIEMHGLDTGPPGCLSFAESVLQESMLSHAPPVS